MFYGILDDVAIFDRALTDAEVQSISTLTGNEPGLVAGWNFDVIAENDVPKPRHDRKIRATRGHSAGVAPG
jgi:hypothetical protein